MELAILRHGEATAPAGQPDFERTLTARGRYQAAAAGQALRERGGAAWRIVASPANRTRETAEIVCGILGHALEAVLWEPAIYNASLETLLDVVTEHGSEGNLLVVGHNPGVTYLMEHICGAGSARRGLAPGSLIRISMSTNTWVQGAGKLSERFDA